MRFDWRTVSSQRSVNLAGFLVCLMMMAFALYSQHVDGLNPCPLCVFQRFAVIGLGLAFLAAAIHDPARLGKRIYGAMIVVIAAGGIVVAGRHLWLQSLPPDQIPSCGPGLDYILDAFPFTQALSMIFEGSGECATVDWTFIGLSMPAWVLIFLLFLGVAGTFNNFRPHTPLAIDSGRF
ncbi:MAG: disulfide bond formation protein B [Gammaproteobacteria bacterium]|nr:disulfide bond formation protein B [Gammaproteobacteria bacterium]